MLYGFVHMNLKKKTTFPVAVPSTGGKNNLITRPSFKINDFRK